MVDSGSDKPLASDHIYEQIRPYSSTDSEYDVYNNCSETDVKEVYTKNLSNKIQDKYNNNVTESQENLEATYLLPRFNCPGLPNDTCPFCSTVPKVRVDCGEQSKSGSSYVTFKTFSGKENYSGSGRLISQITSSDSYARFRLPEDLDTPSCDVSSKQTGDTDLLDADESGRLKDGRSHVVRRSCVPKCKIRQYEYLEKTRRCDMLIASLHRLEQDHRDVLFMAKLLRWIVLVLAGFNVLLFGVGVSLAITLGRNGSHAMQEFETNVTDDIAGLKADFSSVNTVVNKLMTRSRSVLKVTSDNKLTDVGDGYLLRWTAEGHSGQGNLRLSSAGDSVVVGTSGYYVVLASLLYNATLNEIKKLQLRYDIVQQKADDPHITVRELPLGKGILKLGLSTHTTMHLTAGEQIFIRIKPEQKKHISIVPDAHQLTLIEIT